MEYGYVNMNNKTEPTFIEGRKDTGMSLSSVALAFKFREHFNKPKYVEQFFGTYNSLDKEGFLKAINNEHH